tara:strand:- start:127 stop:831 length:705 start_codon:yes stop_codon:yes gene_type:complete
MNECICIIPLRSKSKGLRNKNILKIGNFPMCLYSIISAYKSNIFKKIFICYDSEKYKKIIFKEIKKLKLKIDKFYFYKRSSKSATDNSPTEVVIYELLKKIDYKGKYSCLIQATSPLLHQKDIKQSYKIFKNKNYDTMLSVSSFNKFIWKEVKDKYYPINYSPRKRFMRQKISSFVKENGAFYFFNAKKFLKIRCRLFGKVGAFIMPEERSIEVDTKKDLNVVKNYILSKYKYS